MHTGVYGKLLEHLARHVEDADAGVLHVIGQNANAKVVFFDFALQMIVLLIQK